MEPSPAVKWAYLRPPPSDEGAEWPKLILSARRVHWALLEPPKSKI